MCSSDLLEENKYFMFASCVDNKHNMLNFLTETERWIYKNNFIDISSDDRYNFIKDYSRAFGTNKIKGTNKIFLI